MVITMAKIQNDCFKTVDCLLLAIFWANPIFFVIYTAEHISSYSIFCGNYFE